MKQAFKPLGIAAAVAAASAGYVGVANAQDPAVANNALGDLALVPYYTVNGEWITGIHIVNTSASTQVVKFRFRRAADSLDALDFNVVMSPYDVYAGFLSDDENGNISWSADDTTCTVPETTNGKLQMPAIYRPGAETGLRRDHRYGCSRKAKPSRLLSLPSTTATVHAAGPVPRFAPTSSPTVPCRSDGVIDTTRPRRTTCWTGTTMTARLTTYQHDYEDSGNVLKVSYFIRDNATGIEFGDNAVHIR
jgi:hypothetical protein